MTTNKPTTAPEFLAQAGAIMAQRAAQYDQPGGERSMGRTVEAFNAITGRDLTEAEGWLLLATLKSVRQWQNPGTFHRDSAEDGVAYSALLAEALARGEAQQPTRCTSGMCSWKLSIHPDRKADFECDICGAVSATKP